MSEIKTTLKHAKHIIHPCPNEKKLELLTQLISQNNSKSIIIVSVDSIEELTQFSSNNIKVMNDKELYNSKESTCNLLISYDLPEQDIIYMSRVSRTSEGAIILLDADEQKLLYPIETILGRVIKQKSVEGFEYTEDVKLRIAQPKPERKVEYAFKVAEEKAEQDKKKREEQPKYDKPKFDKPKFEKSKPHKPKSGKKVGRKISIKALKPKED